MKGFGISILVVAVATGLAACGPGGDGVADRSAPSARDLATQLATLEARASLVRDADEIKRLQAAYGYYLDEGLWDQAADLFADDGAIEIGLDGVYVGKERVREYLYALGGGRSGLPPARLNEHMQVMPVVTVAPDGLTAQARWREIMMVGTYGEEAFWGEGPMENTYVKQGGVWKIQSLHWYESMFVPYDGGWRVNEDPTHGVHVSPQLPPDRPPSVAYETWPGVYLPPFHFADAAAAARAPTPVIVRRRGLTYVIEIGGGDAGTPEEQARRAAAIADIYEAANEEGVSPQSALEEQARRAAALADTLETMDEEGLKPTPQDIARRAAALEQELRVLAAQDEIENLQRTFGYYIDESLWSEAAALFSETGTIELENQGVYVGPERILAFLRTLGDEYPRDGRLYDHMQLQPVVHVAPNALSAKGRWRLFSQTAEHGEFARWGSGTYENEYVFEDGAWKIGALKFYPTMSTEYEIGWSVLTRPAAGPSEALPPDRPTEPQVQVYPAAFVTPFHYDHPVYGRPVYFETPADVAEVPANADLDDIAAQLADLEKQVAKVEDHEALENLNGVYGYYLAANAWDEFTDMFADDGTIEIAMRGVYVGKESIRRSMDLYGTPGSRDGLLHNHMQFQPVIHVSEDGRTAQVRSRAFSIMGEYERFGSWMGGVYENTFTKGEDGVWRYQSDRQLNTYFANYDTGWKDLRPSDPPGVSEDNPPDRPPTSPFAMYPTAFLAPFHYPNPVTGREVVVPETE